MKVSLKKKKPTQKGASLGKYHHSTPALNQTFNKKPYTRICSKVHHFGPPSSANSFFKVFTLTIKIAAKTLTNLEIASY